MARCLVALTLTSLALLCRAQGPPLADVLSFETTHPGGRPGGWSGGPAGTYVADDKVVHSGNWAARFERDAGSPGPVSAIEKVIPMDFTGKRIELRGFLRTEAVRGFVALWMREDGEVPRLAFDNMPNQQVNGTSPWAEYSITLPVLVEARQLHFGVMFSGTGKAWADDLRLLVDGKPVWEAPKAARPVTAIDLDHEFDEGSGVALDKLAAVQVENLKALGKVWGFLKYHHPKVTLGLSHWDYELFRVLPAVLASKDRAQANAAMLKWIDGLGPVSKCGDCAALDESLLHLRPSLDWIADEKTLGKDLSESLRSIHRNRVPGKQFYLSLVPGVGNPAFQHELPYNRVRLPDIGFQLLAVYRFWNVIEYWFPYRDILNEDWDAVLGEFIPRVALARDATEYRLELLALTARVHDGHTSVWGSLQVRPPAGSCQLPVIVRFIDHRAVVTGYTSDEAGKATGLQPGDVIAALDGVPVEKLVANRAPYYAASNEPALLRNIAQYLTRGDCGETAVVVRREPGDPVELRIPRVPAGNPGGLTTHDLPGPTFRRLSDDVAYLKLSSVASADAARYIDSAKGTKGLIIDIGNYPKEFMVFALGSRLVAEQTEFARFTTGDLSNPGAFRWTDPISLRPQQPHYSGKIAILVDETSQSQAEYTTMAFRAARGAVVVGSTTAGADGNVSKFALPAASDAMITGIGVFYPDRKPTQRIGIIPDVVVKPTIAGIRAGRDEVMEEALRRILGPEVPAVQIEKMARH
jgi:hypothetical protein